jgi:hypothetical protein
LKYNNKEGQTLIFRGRERKKEKKAHRQQIGLPSETRTTSTGKEHNNMSNNMVEMYFWMLGGVARAV